MSERVKKILIWSLVIIIIAAEIVILILMLNSESVSKSLLWEYCSFIIAPTVIGLLRYIAKQIEYSSTFFYIVFKYILPIILVINIGACVVNIFVRFVK